MSNMRNAASVLVMSLSIILLMIPSNSVLAGNDLLSADDEPENNTIPLWGPRWCQDIVTWRIDNFEKITDNAQLEMKAGIETWSHNNPTTGITGITLDEFNPDDPGKPDIVIKFKKGGGRVQGQALQQSDGGCFTSVKISVSGKAFGRDNPTGQVKSITMQELGHGLGLLHSDNTKDVMYGTVQSPPNVRLSQCDLDAWSAVQANTGATEVFCNETDTGGDTGSGTLTIDITNGPSHNDQSNDGPDNGYKNRDRVHIIVNTGVSGASVHVVIDAEKSRLSGDATTEDGVAHFHYKVNAGRDGTGLYHISASVTNNSETLSCEHESNGMDANTCLSHFSVN